MGRAGPGPAHRRRRREARGRGGSTGGPECGWDRTAHPLGRRLQLSAPPPPSPQQCSPAKESVCSLKSTFLSKMTQGRVNNRLLAVRPRHRRRRQPRGKGCFLLPVRVHTRLKGRRGPPLPPACSEPPPHQVLGPLALERPPGGSAPPGGHRHSAPCWAGHGRRATEADVRERGDGSAQTQAVYGNAPHPDSEHSACRFRSGHGISVLEKEDNQPASDLPGEKPTHLICLQQPGVLRGQPAQALRGAAAPELRHAGL